MPSPFFEFRATTCVDPAHRELADALNRLHEELTRIGRPHEAPPSAGESTQQTHANGNGHPVVTGEER